MEETYIGLLRHAPTGWNKVKRIQGQHDVPLLQDSYGLIDEWMSTLHKYPWSQLLTSDLSRAYLTALAVNKHLNLPLELDPRLREQDWGIWTGRFISQLRTYEPDEVSRQESAGWNFTPPQGESRTQVLQRTLDAMHDATQKWNGKNILVVTHQGNIACVANHLMNKQFLPEEGKLVEKHALHRIVADHTHDTPKFSLIALNEVL